MPVWHLPLRTVSWVPVLETGPKDAPIDACFSNGLRARARNMHTTCTSADFPAHRSPARCAGCHKAYHYLVQVLTIVSRSIALVSLGVGKIWVQQAEFTNASFCRTVLASFPSLYVWGGNRVALYEALFQKGLMPGDFE